MPFSRRASVPVLFFSLILAACGSSTSDAPSSPRDAGPDEPDHGRLDGGPAFDGGAGPPTDAGPAARDAGLSEPTAVYGFAQISAAGFQLGLGAKMTVHIGQRVSAVAPEKAEAWRHRVVAELSPEQCQLLHGLCAGGAGGLGAFAAGSLGLVFEHERDGFYRKTGVLHATDSPQHTALEGLQSLAPETLCLTGDVTVAGESRLEQPGALLISVTQVALPDGRLLNFFDTAGSFAGDPDTGLPNGYTTTATVLNLGPCLASH